MQVHRFHDQVAIHLSGDTVYLTSKQASILADAIVECVDDIELNKFTDSEFKTVNFYIDQPA